PGHVSTHRGAGGAPRAGSRDGPCRFLGRPRRPHGRRTLGRAPGAIEHMTLRPEQIQAKEYFHQKRTLPSAAEIRERGGAAFAALETLLDEVTGDEARARPLPGEWTIQEVVDHLIETHRPSLDELEDLLNNRRPMGGPIPASLQSADPMALVFEKLLDDLKALHVEILAALSAAPDRMTDARAPLVMVVNVKEADGREVPLHWIEELDWKAYAVTAFRLHELDHLSQARKTLKVARAPRSA